MYRRTMREDIQGELLAKKELFDGGVEKDSLASFDVFKGVYVFRNGILSPVTQLDCDWYNNTYRIPVLAAE